MSEAIPAVDSPRMPSGVAAPGIGLIMAIAVAVVVPLVLALALDEKFALLTVVAVVAPIGLYYVFKNPSIAVSVALISHTWSVELVGQYVTPFKIFGVVALLVVARDVITRGRLRSVPRGFSYGMACLLGFVAVGELAAEYEGSISPFFEFGGTLIIFGLFTQTILSTADLRILSRIYTLNLVLTAASVWREVGWSALGESGTRASGICGQPNVLANHLAMSLPFALALLFDRAESFKWRALAVIAILGSVYGEWGAASRGGTIGFACGLFAFAFLTPRRASFRFSAMAVAIVIAGAFATIGPKSFDRVTDTFDSTNDLDAVASERALHARISSEMVPRHPFLGAGTTAFGYERSRYTGVLGGALHSSLLAVAVSYGVLALALYIMLQLSAVYVAARAIGAGPDRVFLAALAASALAAITSGFSGTELFRAEQWSVVGLCHIAAMRHAMALGTAPRGATG